MLLPVKWLNEYVSTEGVSIKELSDKLVSCGFEIEGVIDLSAKIKNVFTAQIVSLAKHPNADKLQIVQLDLKREALVQVITNATNIKVGDIVPVSLDGAVLANGMQIKNGEIRGVPSFGMLCGGEELDLTEADYHGASFNGILILDADTPVGVDINTVIGSDDIVLDVGITANRIDSNSIYGLAREVAAVLNRPLKPLDFSYKTVTEPASEVVAVQNEAKDLCPRYIASVVKDVVLCESPAYIKHRLKAVGLRPINNIVDITNYVLYEVGQPMHAFDLKTIKGNTIVVRGAFNGEQITCLDDKAYTLSDANLVICNKTEPMAVAGIMGGKDCSILPDTSTIVFESARFARDNVRRTSRKLNLRSDSSARFEKGVDFWSQEAGMKRALALISANNWGKILSGEVDSFPVKPEKKEIVFDVNDMTRILGVDIPEERIIDILNSLTIETAKKGEKLVAVIPPYREDMVGVNDIAEEVIRMYGYDHIVPTNMKESGTAAGGKSPRQLMLDKVKEVLIAKGMYEIVTYSFTSPKTFDLLCLSEDDPLRYAIRLESPLGEDFSIMRTTLAAAMIKTISTNYLRGNKTARLFEVAKTYIPKSLPLTELPIEKNVLCLGCLGDDFYGLKAVIEDLLSVLRIEASFRRTVKTYLHPTRAAEIVSKADGTVIGYMGEVDDNVASNYDVDKRIYIAELDLEYLLDVAKVSAPFKVVPKFPAVERDLALVCDKDTEAQRLIDVIKAAGGELLTSAEVFDVYYGGQVGFDKKSVAVKIVCQSAEKTLKDADVNEVVAKVLEALLTIDAKLR